MMTSENLADLALGVKDPIEVCRLDATLASILRVHTPVVFLSRYSLLHIRERHADMTAERLMLLPSALQKGLVIREARRPNHIVFCYQAARETERYIAILKAAVAGHELFVQSFHRAKRRQTRTMLDRGKKLRDHK